MGVVLDPDPFATLRLEGGRFNEQGMPVEALVELSAYRDLVLGVAKEVFRLGNPGRQRVPRGFVDRFQLRLRTVEDGSAKPVLERVTPDGALPSFDDEFTQARDLIENAVAAVENERAIPDEFPRSALILFNRFGQTLRRDESIELRRAAAESGPRYTTAVRKFLVLEVGQTYEEELEDIGWVLAVSGSHMTSDLRLRIASSQQVVAPLDAVTFGSAKAVLEPNGEGPPVRIAGVGQFHRDGRLERFVSVHDVSVLDDPEELRRLDARLDEVGSLSDGWLDGTGLRPAPEAIRVARRVLADLLLGFEVARPRLFPTEEGGVRAEWTLDDRAVTVEFEPTGGFYVVSVDLPSGNAEEPKPSADPQSIAHLLRS